MSVGDELYERSESIAYAAGLKSLGGRNVEDLEEMYKEGSSRDKKNTALQGLQLGVDAWLEGKISSEEYREVRRSAVDHVEAYYNGEELPALELPQTDCQTRNSGLPGDEIVIEDFVDSLNYSSEDVDQVLAVAAGGLEPGILASIELDADLAVARYSTNDFDDSTVKDIENQYRGERVLVVDDTAYTGETLDFVQEHVKDQGAETVNSEAVVEGQFLGQTKALIPHLTRRRWKFRS